jgi:hypothetical protein
MIVIFTVQNSNFVFETLMINYYFNFQNKMLSSILCISKHMTEPIEFILCLKMNFNDDMFVEYVRFVVRNVGSDDQIFT